MSEKEKYEIVLEAIEAGDQTDETLMKMLDAKNMRSVKAQFKFINVLKKWPYFNEEKNAYDIFEGDKGEWEKFQAKLNPKKEAEKKWTKNPQNRRTTLISRVNTKTSKMNTAKKKLDADPDNVRLKLRNTHAICEYQLSVLDLTEFNQLMCEELGISIEQLAEVGDLDSLQQEKMAAAA